MAQVSLMLLVKGGRALIPVGAGCGIRTPQSPGGARDPLEVY